MAKKKWKYNGGWVGHCRDVCLLQKYLHILKVIVMLEYEINYSILNFHFIPIIHLERFQFGIPSLIYNGNLPETFKK